jgi:hypothetical protein
LKTRIVRAGQPEHLNDKREKAMKERVGFVGLGLMGEGMATNPLRQVNAA